MIDMNGRAIGVHRWPSLARRAELSMQAGAIKRGAFWHAPVASPVGGRLE